MLNVIYYPVSAILWFWHTMFATVLDGPTSGIAWALAVVFLVFTLRAMLFKPYLKQVRTQRLMQQLQPQITALRVKHAGDRQALTAATQKLHKEHRVNPVAGCLPVLVQAPVLIGLYHVLRSFNRTGSGGHIPFLSPTQPMSIAQNATTANYVFGVGDVQSFLHAKLFGAPLSAMITTPAAQLDAFTGDVSRVSIAVVAIPLMIIAAIATHVTARASVARQNATAAPTPQSAIMNKLAVWIFPAGALVAGAFLPVAILLYWLSSNAWTLAQQHYAFAQLAAEDATAQQHRKQARAAIAPKPGTRPTTRKKNRPKH